MQIQSSLVVILALTMLTVLSSKTCLAGKRVALVIGNGSYKVAPLSNPVNDATDIATLLESLGFEVIKELNVNKKQMLASIASFSRKLDKSEIGLFYYAGHGMQIKGRNYLIPVEVDVEVESDVEFEAVDAGRLLSRMKTKDDRLNVVVLDACRNNPFARSFRSNSQGLARMDAPRGTIIAYATGPGAVAADGLGRNGIFTKHLLDAMKQPNLDIQEVFNEAGMKVMKETEDRQVPWTSNTPIPRYYLVSGFFMVEELPGPKTVNTTTGSLKIMSEPSGAAVTIDGRKIGNTPLLLQDLPPGDVVARLEKEGFVVEEKVLTVKAGAQVSVSFVLSGVNHSGRITVSPEPADAQVRILNSGIHYTPGMELAPGQYAIEVYREGYEGVTRKILLAAGEELEVEVRLRQQVPQLVSQASEKEYTDPTTGMEFVRVEGGCFQMGDTFGKGGADEQPVHEVCLDGFYIGKYEVTRGEYARIVSYQPNKIINDDRYPVIKVSWDDAQSFIKKLNKQSQRLYRLPTEAEWEYAARSGGMGENYSGSNDPDLIGWFTGPDDDVADSSGRMIHQVGLKMANGLGIYDMSGNVWEWCRDWYGADYYSRSPRSNPTGPSLGRSRVIRGGSSLNKPKDIRASSRTESRQGNRNAYTGLRLVLPDQG